MSISDLDPGSVALVYGTRPEMIKLAPVVKLLGPAARTIHTGQHFTPELADEIAADLDLGEPSANVKTGGMTRASQLGEGIRGLEAPLGGASAVIVQGDTNSTLSAAITANAMEIPLFHVGAGLRSFDRRMPEEHNRVLVDHLADMCWAPTEGNKANLIAERIDAGRIEVTGNTIVEALDGLIPPIQEREQIRAEFGIHEGPYVLATRHRPENVDSPLRLQEILEMMNRIPCQVVLPLHPRTKRRVSEAGFDSLLSQLSVIPSISYPRFLSLLAGCSLSISDSGGIQEEVSVLKVPLIVLRRSTERPEVMGTYAQRISSPDDVLARTVEILNEEATIKEMLRTLKSPFGDGKAAIRMLKSLLRFLGS